MKRKQIAVGDIERVQQKALQDYCNKNFWNEEVCLCSLCGNSGIIDTRQTAISGAGINAGRLHYCICLNGQAMKKEGWNLERSLARHRMVAAIAAVPKVTDDKS